MVGEKEVDGCICVGNNNQTNDNIICVFEKQRFRHLSFI
jgi:hypothetical protein